MVKEFQVLYLFSFSKYLPSYFRYFEEAFFSSFLADNLQNLLLQM